MKKLSFLFIAIAASTAFGFVSLNNHSTKNDSSILANNKTVLKGAEKSGFSESNQNW